MCATNLKIDKTETEAVVKYLLSKYLNICSHTRKSMPKRYRYLLKTLLPRELWNNGNLMGKRQHER